MKEQVTELDIVEAYSLLSLWYARLYLLVKIEEIFFNYENFVSVNENSHKFIGISFDDELEIDYLIDKYSHACLHYNGLLYFEKKKFKEYILTITKENIQECKDIVLENIKIHKETLKGF